MIVVFQQAMRYDFLSILAHSLLEDVLKPYLLQDAEAVEGEFRHDLGVVSRVERLGGVEKLAEVVARGANLLSKYASHVDGYVTLASLRMR